MTKFPDLLVDRRQPEDWPPVKAIYEEGIATKNATFETKLPDWTEWDRDHLSSCRFVVRNDKKVIG